MFNLIGIILVLILICLWYCGSKEGMRTWGPKGFEEKLLVVKPVRYVKTPPSMYGVPTGEGTSYMGQYSYSDDTRVRGAGFPRAGSVVAGKA